MVRFGKELAVKKKMPRNFRKVSRMLEGACIEALDFGSFICCCLKLRYVEETSLQF